MPARHQLTARRKTTGYSQEAIAARLGVNPSTYNRWEVGKVTPYARYRPALAEILDLTLDELDLILENRLDDPDERRISAHEVPMTHNLYASLEHGAGRVDLFHSMVIPGLLQTRAYATAIIAGAVAYLGGGSQEEVKERVGFRMARQRVLNRSPNPPAFGCVIDESALYRVAGSAEVMAEQLYRLVDLADWPTVDIRVLPATSPILCSYGPGGFTLFFSSGADRPYLATTDSVRGANSHDDSPEGIEFHRRFMEHLRQAALSAQDSVAAIVRARESLE